MYVYESQYGHEVEAMTSDPRKYRIACTWYGPTFGTKMEAYKWMFDAQLALTEIDNDPENHDVVVKALVENGVAIKTSSRV